MIKDDHSILYLWKLRTLFMSRLSSIDSLTTAAATYLVGLEKPFCLTDHKSKQKLFTCSALIPPGRKISVHSEPQLFAKCFLDPYGSDYTSILKHFPNQEGSIKAGHPDLNSQITALHSIYKNIAAPDDAYRALTQLVFPDLELDIQRISGHIDPRINQAILTIQQQHTDNQPNQALATRCGLSETQLQRGFKRSTGIPIRRYRLWHRLFVSSNYLSDGASLTEAAHGSGFTDSAHFCHTFRALIGLVPSIVFRGPDRTLIFTDPHHSFPEQTGFNPSAPVV